MYRIWVAGTTVNGDFRVNMYRKQEKASSAETTQTMENPTQSSAETTQTIENPTQSLTETTQTIDFQFTEKDKEVLKVIQQNPELTQREMALELGWSVDRVKYYLNKMKKLQVIKRVGSSHKGHWEILR